MELPSFQRDSDNVLSYKRRSLQECDGKHMSLLATSNYVQYLNNRKNQTV